MRATLGLVLCLLIVGSACRNDCHPKHKDFVDEDEDGVCDALDVCEGGDDAADEDGDGVPDDCDAEVLASVVLTDVNLGAPSESIRVWLAYDAVGSLQSWTSVDPGWTFERAEQLREPKGYATFSMSGWTGFNEALTDGSNDELAIVIEATDSPGARIIEKEREEDWRIGRPDLQGREVTRIEVSATDWRTDVNSVVGVKIDFLGR